MTSSSSEAAMPTGTTTASPRPGGPGSAGKADHPTCLALVVAWSATHPEQIGAVLPLPRGTSTPLVLVGRGPGRSDDPAGRLQPVRQRPGRNRSTGPLSGRALGRRQLLLRGEGIFAEDAELAARFGGGGKQPGAHAPQLSTGLVAALVGHRYRLEVRELEALLWTALATSPGDRLCLTDPVREQLAQIERGGEPTAPAARGLSPSAEQLPVPMDPLDSGPSSSAAVAVDPSSLSPETIQASLDRLGGKQEQVWRELGLKNRWVLTRLIKKYGLVVRRPDAP